MTLPMLLKVPKGLLEISQNAKFNWVQRTDWNIRCLMEFFLNKAGARKWLLFIIGFHRKATIIYSFATMATAWLSSLYELYIAYHSFFLTMQSLRTIMYATVLIFYKIRRKNYHWGHFAKCYIADDARNV